MIDKSHGKFIPCCDGCFVELTAVDTFDEAKEQMQDEGWTTIKNGDSWENYCVDCNGN